MSKKFRILASDGLAPTGKAVLEQAQGVEYVVEKSLARDKILDVIGGFDGLIVRSATQVDAELLERATRLKVVARAGVGVDNVEVPAATARGVLVMNTPGGNTVTTAEHSIALMMAAARHVASGTASLKRGEWKRADFVGTELRGKTLGVVGLGNIGRVVAELARGLKMRVIGVDPFVSEDAARKMGVTLATLDEMLPQVDVLSVHVPAIDETRGLINAERIARMKKGVILVNCARGGIIDEADLLAALESGHVYAAGLDVYSKEPPDKGMALLQHPRVVCTPHLGASTEEAQQNVSRDAAEQVVEYLCHGVVKNAVNAPSMGPEAIEAIGPFLELCEKMAALASQLRDGELGAVKRLQVDYFGEIAGHDVTPLTTACLKGYLAPFLDVPVNAVNAPGIAEARGIVVVEQKSATPHDFISSIGLTVAYEKGDLRLRGALFGRRDARIVGVDDFRMEVIPDGHILVIHNLDQPGVVGTIGTSLGNAGVNISRMQLGLNREKGEALAMISVDSEVGPAILEYLEQLPAVKSARQVKI